jgi:Uma2 family endonuclease
VAQFKLLEEEFLGGNDSGIRLERVGGLTVWEAHPVYKHQAVIDRIRRTLHSIEGHENHDGCGYIDISDVSILFPDGSEKRPDISIFCREPDEEEQESVLTMIPEAVIEVISKGYEAKDYDVGVPFYLANGIKDVVTLDPRSKEVRHYRADSLTKFTSPVEIILECGCICTV